MTQLQLPMLTVYEGPRLVSPDVVAPLATYRDAVRMCHFLRLRKKMTNAQLAEESGCYASHLSDYLSQDLNKRDLPAKHIEAFERACQNRCITQWLAGRAQLTILETFIQARAA